MAAESELSQTLIFIQPLYKEQNDDRTFSGFGTVEIRDNQGDLVQLDGNEDKITDILDTWMGRGGIILDSHSNKHVGQASKWSWAVDPKTDKKGIYINGHIFKDYSIDDQAWDAIREGNYKGFSLGGRSLSPPTMTRADGGVANRIPDLEIWEFSVCRNPANPAATFDNINYVAKSGDGLAKQLLMKYITQEGSEWVVHAESGKVLGKHPTKAEAEAQLRAVEANKAQTVGGFKSPEPGNLPAAGAKMLAEVYAKLRAKKTPKESAAKQAWAAVHNAGYSSKQKQDEETDADPLSTIAQYVANAIGFEGDMHEFEMGLEDELEHEDVTGGDPIMTGKIAAVHLKEDPQYYTHLNAMEGKSMPETQKQAPEQGATGEDEMVSVPKSHLQQLQERVQAMEGKMTEHEKAMGEIAAAMKAKAEGAEHKEPDGDEAKKPEDETLKMKGDVKVSDEQLQGVLKKMLASGELVKTTTPSPKNDDNGDDLRKTGETRLTGDKLAKMSWDDTERMVHKLNKGGQ